MIVLDMKKKKGGVFQSKPRPTIRRRRSRFYYMKSCFSKNYGQAHNVEDLNEYWTFDIIGSRDEKQWYQDRKSSNTLYRMRYRTLREKLKT